jgi:transcriptional regulator with XRE-family HTH domain
MNLRTYLKLSGLSEMAFAQQIGVASTTINRLVRGKTKPSFGLVQRIFEATNGAVTPNDLFDVEDKTLAAAKQKSRDTRRTMLKK